MSCAGMSIGAGVGSCTGVRPSTGASMGGRDTGRLAATAGTGETDRADTVGATGTFPALLGDAAGDADTAGTVGAITAPPGDAAIPSTVPPGLLIGAAAAILEGLGDPPAPSDAGLTPNALRMSPTAGIGGIAAVLPAGPVDAAAASAGDLGDCTALGDAALPTGGLCDCPVPCDAASGRGGACALLASGGEGVTVTVG